MARNKHGWVWFDFDDYGDEMLIDGRQPKHKFKEKKGMKRILTLIASVAMVAAGVAKAQTVANQVIVSQYSNWSVQGTVALASGNRIRLFRSAHAASQVGTRTFRHSRRRCR